jgi:predicted CoA-binding protein
VERWFGAMVREIKAREIEEMRIWKNVAVVGLSKDASKDSHGVASYL